MLAILDYKAGNQTSVKRSLDYLKIDCEITNDLEVLKKADGIIFPGVGAAGQAMNELKKTGIDEVLKSFVNKKPILGICLGCQIMLDYSEENNTQTLGIIEGKCVKFPDNLKDHDEDIRIPHMGWNNINIKKQSPLFKDIAENAQFYFVHSYYVEVADSDIALASTNYGLEFCSVYGKDGLWAVQFHPEKSGEPGLQLLQNFHHYCIK